MRWLSLALALPLAACLQLGTETGDGTGAGVTTPSGSGGGGSSSGGSSGAGVGTNCSTDPATQITLCERIPNCPGVDVDPGVFPSCGFQLHAASTFDIECWCGDALCPVGAATSCTTAGQMLDQQTSSLVVCEEASLGSCVYPGVDAGSGSSSTTACDKSCESQCAGEPGCIQLCGC